MASEILSSSVVQESMKDLGRKCRADWTQLGKAHILMTGGTGFFGSWMVASFKALRDLGFPIELTVLSRDPEPFLQRNPSLHGLPGLAFRKGDVVDATIPFSITHILHFATTSTPQGEGQAEAEIRRTVVEGTRHMLAEAKRVGANRFLFASSGAVYSKEKSDRPNEGDLGNGLHLSLYGTVKREAEELCRQAGVARDIETVIARPFTFCGPLFPVEGPYVISNFMSGILNGVPLHVRTPHAIRSFLDGRDLAPLLWKLLAQGKNGEAYNVGSDESVTMSELADLMRSVALKVSRRVPDVRLTQTAAIPAADVYRPSIQRLKSEFGWQPSITLRESLRDQARWAIESGY